MYKLDKDTNLDHGVHVIKFFATWCGPCRLYAPVFERASTRNPDLNFYEVDVDESRDIREEYDVQSLPTTIIVEDGSVVKRVSGAQSTKGLDSLLTHVLDSSHANSP